MRMDHKPEKKETDFDEMKLIQSCWRIKNFMGKTRSSWGEWCNVNEFSWIILKKAKKCMRKDFNVKWFRFSGVVLYSHKTFVWYRTPLIMREYSNRFRMRSLNWFRDDSTEFHHCLRICWCEFFHHITAGAAWNAVFSRFINSTSLHLLIECHDINSKKTPTLFFY